MNAPPASRALFRSLRVRCTLDDLDLPATDLGQLDAIVREAGLRRKGAAVLFHGPSGPDKVAAAEGLAGSLQASLYRIDLSRVVGKYVGETERRLAAIFDEAEGSGAVLLFDEADALFGKRSEVRDSHDRYANVGIAYLLERIDAYDGVAILVAGGPDPDEALLRRMRWRVAFPPRTGRMPRPRG